MPPAFVIDASIIGGWLLEDELSDYAIAAVECLDDEIALAPSFMLIESGNIFLKAMRRGRITPLQAKEYLNSAITLELMLEPLGIDTVYVSNIAGLAQKYDLTAYDSIYLELALRYQLPLATLDNPLAKAAKKCGVELFRP